MEGGCRVGSGTSSHPLWPFKGVTWAGLSLGFVGNTGNPLAEAPHADNETGTVTSVTRWSEDLMSPCPFGQ